MQSKVESKRQKLSDKPIYSLEREEDSGVGVGEMQYVKQVLDSFGYDSISETVRQCFCGFVVEWITWISANVAVKDQKIIRANYLHQLYPLYWKIYIKYFVDKKKTPSVNDSSKDSDLLFEDSQISRQSKKLSSTKDIEMDSETNDVIQARYYDIFYTQKHYQFLNKRSLLMEKDFYRISRNCLSSVSSSKSFISEKLQLRPNDVICQFSHLVLFYKISSIIGSCSHLYQVKENDLLNVLSNESFNKLANGDLQSVDIKNDIKTALCDAKPSVKRTKKKRVQEIQQDIDEFDIIKNEM